MYGQLAPPCKLLAHHGKAFYTISTMLDDYSTLASPISAQLSVFSITQRPPNCFKMPHTCKIINRVPIAIGRADGSPLRSILLLGAS